jgi:hypothetical protein
MGRKSEKKKESTSKITEKSLFWTINFISTFQAVNYPEKINQRCSTKIHARKLMKLVILEYIQKTWIFVIDYDS